MNWLIEVTIYILGIIFFSFYYKSIEAAIGLFPLLAFLGIYLVGLRCIARYVVKRITFDLVK